MAQLSVVLVTDSFLPQATQATTTVRHVADRLIDTGLGVTIVAPGPGLTTYRGCRVVRSRSWSRPGKQLRQALREASPDLVHVTTPEAFGRTALEQARRLGFPTVVVEQSAVPAFPPDFWLDGVARRADRLLVTSRWVHERLADREVPSQVWTPGVDTDAFHPRLRSEALHDRWAGPDRAVVVGYVGDLRRRQGVRRLRGLAAVPGIRVVLIGEGPQRGWLRSQLPGAAFLGPMSTGDLGVAMASLDVLVHPGRTETCCHALRAGAASGVALVAHRAGGSREVVRHQESGLLTDTNDAGGLRRAVAAVARDRDRGLLGAAARAYAEQRDWARAVDELVSVHYAAALASGAPRAA